MADAEIISKLEDENLKETKDEDIEIISNEDNVECTKNIIINEENVMVMGEDVTEVDNTNVKNINVDLNKNTNILDDTPVIQSQQSNNGSKKIAMSTSMESEAVRAAYDDVRADNSEIQWSVFKFEGSRIMCSAKGVEFDEFRNHFGENERAFGYIRIQTGDEMSKRQKFLFVTWIGPGVSVLQRAKMSTDKSVIKSIISNFAVELQLEHLNEFDLSYFVDSLNKASGANYGTGVRVN